MNTLLHRDGDDDLDENTGRQDREFTLGTTTILGLFFSLAVLCAVFFGFGYSVGHKSPPPNTPNPLADGQAGNAFSAFKPAAGNPLTSAPEKSGTLSVTLSVDNTSPDPAPSRPKPAPQPVADDSGGDATAAEPAPAPPPAAHPAAPIVIAPAPAPMPVAISGTTGAIVQVAAVSHQEDADLLVTTLKRRGYAVVVRNESQDKLLHVQVGPFASHKDADAMRQRLLNDGFNAIVKDSK